MVKSKHLTSGWVGGWMMDEWMDRFDNGKFGELSGASQENVAQI